MHLYAKGKIFIKYSGFATYVYQYITAKEEHALDQPHRELKNSIADRTTLEKEKPLSVNTNVHEGAIAKQKRLPRGVGNVPKTEAFGEPIDMTGKFEIDESFT